MGRRDERRRWPSRTMRSSSLLMTLNSGAGATYTDKVMGYSPTSLWMLKETSGAATVSEVSAAQNGTYTGVTLANGTTPWGDPCPYFDGTTAHADIISAALTASFPGTEGTLVFWMKAAAGTWTNGTSGTPFHVQGNGGQSRVSIFKESGNNEMKWWYRADGESDTVTDNAMASYDWYQIAMTWSDSANEMKAYKNATQTGATKAANSTWSDPLDTAFIGSLSSGSTEFIGWMAGVAIFGSVLTQPQLADLYTY